MPNRRIDQLDINPNPLTGNELVPIFDLTNNTTERVSINTIASFVDSTKDTYITGGTYDNSIGTITFYNNSGGTFQVSGFLTGYTNYYTTGATLTGNILSFDRNDIINAYSVDLSPLKFTGNTSGDCISNIHVTNIHSCSPLYINPNNEGNVNFGSSNQVSIELPTGKLNTTTLKVSSGATAGYVLTSDASGNATWQPSETNLGNILFVSEEGNDSTAVKGDLNRPWRNLYIAKSAATSGDTVYVFPQTIVYDNRTAAGNPWNNRQGEMNLWKDGVTYYFTPNTKIMVYNQTVTGQDLYLFRPNGGKFETCTVLGHLDYEQTGVGPDTSIGRNLFFQGTTIGAESGYTFYAEVRNLTSNHSEIVNVERQSISLDSNNIISKITIISETENYTYLGGQTASGSMYVVSGGNNVMDLKFNSKYRNYGGVGYPFYIQGNLTRSRLNFYGEEIYNTGYNIFRFRNLTGTINANIKNIYYNTSYTPFSLFGSVINGDGSGGWTCNLNGNLLDYAPNTQTTGVFYLASSNNTLNFEGNIITNTSSGVGRFIAATTTNSTININGDIHLVGTGTTTNVLFQPNGNGTINYSGKISGNYGGPLIKTYNGTMNINNSFITSTTGTTSLQLLQNGATSLGTCRINNSHITLSNNSTSIINGNYIKTLVNNSTIINSGSGETISNSVTSGSLQLLNSTIMTSNSTGNTINYSSTSPVISSNSTVNNNYSVSDLRGNITILTDLIY